MESTPRRYETLGHGISHHEHGVDRRHLTTLAWMLVGLMQARVVRLTAWAPDVHGRAVDAQSRVRRCERGLHKKRIDVPQREGPLIQHAWSAGGTHVRYRALDTATVWATSGLTRLSLLSRGRARPRVWPVLQPPRRRGSSDPAAEG